ncbi:MAG: tyrosine-type recombinase/integrase [Dehalococcoidales bacterium]|nr:tyrosine-type recombinase/integrase [Dehalococcoidales bacterium]
MLDNLTYESLQAQPTPALDTLTTSDNLANLLRGYLLSCKVEGKSPKTLESYRQVAVNYIAFAKAHDLPLNAPDITPDYIRSYLLSLQEKGLSPFSSSSYYRTLHAFFSWLKSQGLMKESPMERMKAPKTPRKIIKPFSQQDIENLLLLCSGDRFLDIRNKAIVLLFLDTGIRLKELSDIQLKDVDFDRETIKVMGKGAKERIVRFGKTTQKAVLRYLLRRNDSHPCLWVTEERTPITKEGIQTIVRRLCERAGIKDTKLGPHTFRHTAAINYLRNGGDLFTLQCMLGHSTLEMTRRYTSSLGAEDMIRVHKKASPVDRMGL